MPPTPFGRSLQIKFNHIISKRTSITIRIYNLNLQYSQVSPICKKSLWSMHKCEFQMMRFSYRFYRITAQFFVILAIAHCFNYSFLPLDRIKRK